MLFVGLARGGKSTQVAIQMGATCERLGRGLGLSPPHSTTARTPRTSNSYRSATLNVGLYIDEKTNTNYLDLPGFGENRGPAIERWTTFCQSYALNLVERMCVGS